MKGKEYYLDIISVKSDMEAINEILNMAIKDSGVSSIATADYSYSYLCSTAASLGFKFGEHFNLLR